jgi:hypothetical protein
MLARFMSCGGLPCLKQGVQVADDIIEFGYSSGNYREVDMMTG